MPGTHRAQETSVVSRFLTRTKRRLRDPRAIAAVTSVVIVTAGAVTIPAIANPAAPSETVSLTTSDSAWTSARTPDRVLRTPYLAASSSEARTYLKFDLSSVGGRDITSATLVLRVASTTATQRGVSAYASGSGWSSSSLTARSAPPATGQLLSTSSPLAVRGQTVRVPLSTDGVDAADGIVSFRVAYDQRFVSTTFHRTGFSAPRLELGLGSVTSTPEPTTSATPTPTPTVPAAPTASPTPPPSDDPPVDAGSSALPFAVAPANSSSKKVFAHYFPPYPVSLDNAPSASDYYARNYLQAGGEGGAFASSGGLLRDRPLPRSPLPGDWRATDLETEVRQASSAGIDGFVVDVLSLSGQNWTTTTGLARAAAKVGKGFTVTPNLDMTASAGQAGIPTIAASLEQLYATGAAYRLSDGRYVLSTFAAERQSPGWWTQLKDVMRSQYHRDIALISVFINASDQNMVAYAPVSYALGAWGARTPTVIAAQPNMAARAHALGVKWMAPVAVQDVRPRSFVYAEAGNTETLRASWARAISDGADLVQLTTWNDYSESTSFAPSADHGWTFLDLNAYWMTQFKTGALPRVTGDALYVTHRIQPVAAIPSLAQRLMTATLGGGSMTPRDTVEVASFLTAPANVTARVGSQTYSWSAPAGFSTHTVPLSLGQVSASASRSGAQVMAVTSPYPVVSRPLSQDLQYYGVSTRGR